MKKTAPSDVALWPFKKFHLEEGFFHGRHQEEETAPYTCGVVLKCISPAPVVYRAQRSCRCVHSSASFRDRDDSQVPDNCLRCGVRDNGLSSPSPLVMEDQLAVGLFFGGSASPSITNALERGRALRFRVGVLGLCCVFDGGQFFEALAEEPQVPGQLTLLMTPLDVITNATGVTAERCTRTPPMCQKLCSKISLMWTAITCRWWCFL